MWEPAWISWFLASILKMFHYLNQLQAHSISNTNQHDRIVKLFIQLLSNLSLPFFNECLEDLWEFKR